MVHFTSFFLCQFCLEKIKCNMKLYHFQLHLFDLMEILGRKKQKE